MPSARTDTQAQRLCSLLACRDSAARYQRLRTRTQTLRATLRRAARSAGTSYLAALVVLRACVPWRSGTATRYCTYSGSVRLRRIALALAGRSGACCPVVPCASSAGWDAGQWTQWAPHHPQCRCWQVLVPSDAAHPPCPLRRSSTAGWLVFPFHPASCRLCLSPASTLLLHYFYFIAPSPSFPLPLPLPVKGLLSLSQLASRQPRASNSHLRLLCPVAASRRNRQFQRQIRHLDDKPAQACRHPNLIGTDATDSLPKQFDERKKGPPLPRSLQRSASAQLFRANVVSSPIDNRPPACTCHCFAANSSFGASALVHSARLRHTVPVSAALDKLVHQYLDRVTGR
ncbi:hypothetical protein TASIC1_0018004200 [Trichoderma asperellum]|uniref:Uncharacterized protein n=1 Tax=Trichoderma asperellum TaxID=101201 RepID=A0A6V8R5W3_TRIAP|nr:hypothetical protein TASIC1_0018004200 [Trichoderma asperellum]